MDSLRLSDADREAAVELLSEHFSVGRLTKDEFDERSDAVWSARTRGDLAPVFVDLPVPPTTTRQRPTGRWTSGRRGFPVPLVPALILLILLTVVTHLPFVLLGLAVWFFVARRR